MSLGDAGPSSSILTRAPSRNLRHEIPGDLGYERYQIDGLRTQSEQATLQTLGVEEIVHEQPPPQPGAASARHARPRDRPNVRNCQPVQAEAVLLAAQWRVACAYGNERLRAALSLRCFGHTSTRLGQKIA